MKYFFVITLAAAASAARLDKVYLPPHAGASGGASAGLQTPFSAPGSSQQYQQAPTGSAQDYQGQNYQSQDYQNQNHQSQNYQSQDYQNQNHQSQNYQSQNLQAQSQNQAEILRYENEVNADGFHYAYETSDGTKAEQEGRVIPGAKPEEGSLQVSGSYSYIGDDGQTYSVTYTADENGFRPEGAHLPTPPPIPEAILKSLQLTTGTGAQYNSGKSSYDADSNGY